MAQNLSGLAATTFPITRLGEAWRNRQGLFTLLATFVGVAVLIGLGVASGVGALFGLLALAAYALLLLGTATAGQQFMDQAMGRDITPTFTAMAASPMIVLRLIGLVILLGLAVLAWFIVAAVLLFVCKLPVVGGVLLAVVVPVLTFSGALVFAGVYVALSLAAPALFEGHGIKHAFSQLWAVALQRPVEALLNLFILFFVVGFAMMLVGGFIFTGFFSTMGLTAGIVGSPMGPMMGPMMGGMGDMEGYGRGPGMGGFTLFGMLVGGGIVWAVVAALAGALGLLGVCLTYLKLTDGLDMAHAEAALESAVAKTREKARQAADEARRRTQELQEAARQRAEQARERQAQAAAAAAASAAAAAEAAPRPEPRPDPSEPPAFEETIIMPSAQQPPPPPPRAAPAPMAPPVAPPVIDPTVPDWRCPACHATVTPDDIFCGACGHKLK